MAHNHDDHEFDFLLDLTNERVMEYITASARITFAFKGIPTPTDDEVDQLTTTVFFGLLERLGYGAARLADLWPFALAAADSNSDLTFGEFLEQLPITRG